MKIAYLVLSKYHVGGWTTYDRHFYHMITTYKEYLAQHDVECHFFVLAGSNRLPKLHREWGWDDMVSVLNYKSVESMQALLRYDLIHMLDGLSRNHWDTKGDPLPTCLWVLREILFQRPFIMTNHGISELKIDKVVYQTLSQLPTFLGWVLSKPNIKDEMIALGYKITDKTLHRPIFLSRMNSAPVWYDTYVWDRDKAIMASRWVVAKGIRDLYEIAKAWASPMQLEIWGDSSNMGVGGYYLEKEFEEAIKDKPQVTRKSAFMVDDIDEVLCKSMFLFDLSRYAGHQGTQFTELEAYANGVLPVVYDTCDLFDVCDMTAVVLNREDVLADPKHVSLRLAALQYGPESKWCMEAIMYNYNVLQNKFTARVALPEFIGFYRELVQTSAAVY